MEKGGGQVAHLQPHSCPVHLVLGAAGPTPRARPCGQVPRTPSPHSGAINTPAHGHVRSKYIVR